MGSSSRSNSTQTTSNQSTTFGIQGANNGLILNGSGNTVTDGGAFDIVGRIVDVFPQLFSQGAGMVDSGFNAVTDVALMGERQNENVLNAMVDLYGETSNAQSEMLRLGADVLTDTGEILNRQQTEAYDFGREAMGQVGKTADSAIFANSQVTQAALDGNYDLTALVATALEKANLNNTDLASKAMDNSTYLATELSSNAMAATNDANKDAFRQLADGFDSMMGFAEQYSRSDGAALAESNNKTMLFALGGVTVTALAVAYVMRGK
ncbi:hypothetical protein [Shewanella algae]|uniref:hypothetical protein n=1 Tax=Shewanella algae TaxID=38313 RepID=UPI0031F502AB